ncbi:lipase family protein [Nocardia huaxiensis]|uniref:Triacylglycerol lipase n=1 Tax=Nocardia huaxiensis TaxID=2755382 RepID=A0A7D6VE33_9NOCA|nr:lipase family protein [Nocardia huaxiensis]QLY33091.1 hypothetical protein H0264_13400 [Nocardia huaxiensis]UFS93140.1 lipase family protein [Nocardia huaxiensis]
MLLAVGFSLAAPVSVSAEVADDFYQPPAGYEMLSPGTILRTRAVQVKALQQFPLRVQAWQLLYRTTDGDGRPYASVTTVMIPEGPVQTRPLLSYQMAYDAIQRECMPSYSMIAGGVTDPADVSKQSGRSTVPYEVALAATGLAKGWAVAVPDPGGIDNHFLTPRLMGYTTLDGIRAAESFTPLGLPGADTEVALWGYSGGGVATSWAAEVQPAYAPELNIAGAAIGAPVQDFGAAMRSADGRYTAGLIPIGMAAMAKDSPEFAEHLDRHLSPLGRAEVAAAALNCTATTVSANRFRTVNELLSTSLDEALADPVIGAAITARARGAAVPTTPLYVLNGVHDEVSSIAAVDDLVANYCARGASITYVRDAVPDSVIGSHGIVALTGAGGILAWLDRALSTPGPVQPAGCTTTTVASTALDPVGAAALPDYVDAALRTLLGQALGTGR